MEAATRAAVRRLMSFGRSTEERAEAAREVGVLAREDERRKRLLAELGVVPPLVSMLLGAGEGGGARLAAAGALLELARGAHRNKVRIVQAGLLEKLPRLMEYRELLTSHDLALLLLSISSLAGTDFGISSAQLLPFLVATLGAADVPAGTKLPCLAALRNLSATLQHVRDVASSGAVRVLLALSLERETSEPALSVLGALVSATAAGRREVEEDETAPRALLEAMASRHERSPACQEHATYLVMVLVHGNRGLELRRRMRQLGAVQALIEVSLLGGSPLARKRAAKILQWFKDEGQDGIRAHSGPRTEGPSLCHGGGDDDDDGDRGAKDRRRAVDSIVKQSLDKNMKFMMRRATAAAATAAAEDMTNLKLLVQSSSSKSLPC